MDYTYRNKYEYGSENKRYMHFSDVMRKYTVPSPRKSTTEDHDYEGLEGSVFIGFEYELFFFY